MYMFCFFFFLRLRRPPRSTQNRSSAASDVYKRQLAGLKDILTKCLGTDTALNVVKATVAGLRSLQDPQRISERRGKSVEYLLGKKFAEKYNQTRSEMLAAMGQTQVDEQNKPALDAAEAAEAAEAYEEDGEPEEEGRPSTKRGHRKTSHS